MVYTVMYWSCSIIPISNLNRSWAIYLWVYHNMSFGCLLHLHLQTHKSLTNCSRKLLVYPTYITPAACVLLNMVKTTKHLSKYNCSFTYIRHKAYTRFVNTANSLCDSLYSNNICTKYSAKYWTETSSKISF